VAAFLRPAEESGQILAIILWNGENPDMNNFLYKIKNTAPLHPLSFLFHLSQKKKLLARISLKRAVWRCGV
jgi:hypothetical protein